MNAKVSVRMEVQNKAKDARRSEDGPSHQALLSQRCNHQPYSQQIGPLNPVISIQGYSETQVSQTPNFALSVDDIPYEPPKDED